LKWFNKRDDDAMSIKNDSANLVFVNSATLKVFLAKAQKRIIFAKASFFKDEVEILIDLIKQKNIRCELFFEPEDKTVRYGFGEADALKLIRDKKDLFTIKFVNNIRMAMLMIDNNTLLFSPTALSWEIEPGETSFPNGMFFGPEVTEKILKQMDFENMPEEISNIIPFSFIKTKISDQAENDKKLDEMIYNLDKNPPVDPARLRNILVYRNIFKIVQREIRGINIERKSVNLNPFKKYLSPGIDVTRLRSGWSVINKKDIQNIEIFKKYLEKFENLFNDYTIPAGRFGAIIETKNIKELEKTIDDNKKEYIQNLKNANNSESLKNILEKSKKELIVYLFSIVEKNNDSIYAILSNNLPIKRRVLSGEIDKNTATKEIINDIIDSEMVFPVIDDFIKDFKIIVDYYDVSDELLNDVDFDNIIKKSKIKDSIREYFDAYEQKKGLKPQ